MKKNFLFLVFLLLGGSCTTNETSISTELSATIPIDEAVLTLKNAFSAYKPKTKTGSSPEIAEILNISKKTNYSKCIN